MNEIRPGILVEIQKASDPRAWVFIGHVGVVLARDPGSADYWIVEGAERIQAGQECSWRYTLLRPINDGTVDNLIEKWQADSRQGVPA